MDRADKIGGWMTGTQPVFTRWYRMLQHAWQRKARHTSEFTRCVQKCREKPPIWRACMFLRLLQSNAERRHVGLQWYEQKQTRCVNIEQHLRRPARGGRLGQARKRRTVKSADGLQTGTLCNVYGSTSNRGEFWQPGRTTPVKSLLRRREKGLKRGNQSARLSVCARHSSWRVFGLPPLVLQHSGMTLDLFQR